MTGLLWEDIVRRCRISRQNLGPGRPRKLTSRDKRVVTRLVLNDGAKIAVESTKKLNRVRKDKFSAKTVRKALKQQGLRTIKKKKKLRLTLAHRRARLNWVLAHSECTIDDWKIFIWSDKTKIN